MKTGTIVAALAQTACGRLRDTRVAPMRTASCVGIAIGRGVMSEAKILTAAECGDVEALRQLLDRKVSVNTKGEDGWSALMLATRHPNAVRLLLDEGANVNACNVGGYTALMSAAWKGRADVVRMLLDAGANINVKDEESYTALDYARMSGGKDVAALLEQRGAESGLLPARLV